MRGPWRRHARQTLPSASLRHVQALHGGEALLESASFATYASDTVYAFSWKIKKNNLIIENPLDH